MHPRQTRPGRDAIPVLGGSVGSVAIITHGGGGLALLGLLLGRDGVVVQHAVVQHEVAPAHTPRGNPGSVGRSQPTRILRGLKNPVAYTLKDPMSCRTIGIRGEPTQAHPHMPTLSDRSTLMTGRPR
jgi:hypothetical protein